MLDRLKALVTGEERPTSAKAPVVVVSGLPRSGTSMMMKMLEAGGIQPVTDEERAADEDNPRGYYELERVKKLPDGDTSWVSRARGKAVKVISALVTHLPPGEQYQVVFMRRRMPEILASQQRMLENRDEGSETSDEEMARLFEKHLDEVTAWLERQPHMAVHYADYNALLEGSGDALDALHAFFDHQLDRAAMADVIEPRLYRQRAEQ